MSSMTPTKRAAHRVLLVDDFMPQLSAWAHDLEADGRIVFQAPDRAEAQRLASAHLPQVAIVDLFLGSEDGLDCVRDLKAIAPDMFVIVVSSDMSVAFAMASVRAGADDVMVKPVQACDVLRRFEHGIAHTPARTSLTLEQVEWEHISRALVESKNNITQAAERLGIYRQTLQRKLRKRGRERAGN
jgi:two-component system, response regulator RegA